jgi:hypothetical protein
MRMDQGNKAGWWALALAACAGCSGDPLSDDGQIAAWANAASSLGVFTHGYEPLAFADGELAFADPSCPRTSDDGAVVTIAGDGCRDSAGDVFVGQARVGRTSTGRQVTFSGYGRSRDGGPAAKATGSFDVKELGPDQHQFEVALVVAGGVRTEIDYTGTVTGGYSGPTVWSGAGTVARDGWAIDSGRVRAETADQLRDNEICSGQSASGTTTLTSDEHTVIILYDGATDCDDDAGARWRRDGRERGLVTGVVCAIAPPGARASSGAGGPPSLALIAVSLGAVARRPRRSRARGQRDATGAGSNLRPASRAATR